MRKNWDKDVLICSCSSTDHQMIIYFNETDDASHNQCYVHIHLTNRSFWRRVVYGIKYIFGRKSRFGAWDEFIFNYDDADKIQELANYLKKKNEKIIS